MQRSLRSILLSRCSSKNFRYIRSVITFHEKKCNESLKIMPAAAIPDNWGSKTSHCSRVKDMKTVLLERTLERSSQQSRRFC